MEQTFLVGSLQYSFQFKFGKGNYFLCFLIPFANLDTGKRIVFYKLLGVNGIIHYLAQIRNKLALGVRLIIPASDARNHIGVGNLLNRHFKKRYSEFCGQTVLDQCAGFQTGSVVLNINFSKTD